MWGASLWGRAPWGGPGFGPTAAVAVRENVIRVAFSEVVYASDLGDAEDAIRSATWALATLPLSRGLDSFAPREVAVVGASIPTEVDGVPPVDVGRYVDLALDRPLSPWPAAYTLTPGGVWNAARTILAGVAVLSVEGAYRELVRPSVEQGSESHDLANPQSRIAAVSVDAQGDAALGCFAVDDTGDYALDSGVTSFRKRVLRVITTAKNGFAHLPGYGAGLVQKMKQTGTTARLAALVTDVETQVRRDPDCLSVEARTTLSPTRPGLMRMDVFAQPKHGKALRFEVPFLIG